MKNKSAGFYLAAITCVLSVVTLILLLIYGSRGGQVQPLVYAALAGAIILEAAALLGEKPWTDFTGIIAAALVAYAMMTVLSDGIWNISEAINGIKMVGIPELAGMNYAMFGLSLAAVILTVISCFTRKSK